MDHLGSTRAMTQANGTKCYEADYLPYGQEQNILGGCSSAYKFTGYEYDGESGNYYAFARYYSVRTQRFLSADPLMGDAGGPQSLNRYAYTLNNPVNFTDPTGLCVWPGGSTDCWWWWDGYPERSGGRVSITVYYDGHGGSRVVHHDRGGSAPPPSPIGSEPFPESNGFLPGETAGVPDWLDGPSDLSQWVIVNLRRPTDPMMVPAGFNIQIWVFALARGTASLTRRAHKALKTWPSYPKNSCQVYSDSGRPDLASICGGIFGSSVFDSVRGCLQQHYNPDFYKGVGGYENKIGERKKKHTLADAWGYGALGLSAHAVCASGLILQ